jgi:molybdopterin-guanine dinucleotide biosynthesis protein A
MYKLPAVIFAGGKSSRMGRDKALLPFGTEATLSQFQYKRLSQLFEHVYLSAKTDKFNFECKVIEDRYPESSPLVGICSIFEELCDDAVFILSVDAPLVDETIIDTLVKVYQEDPQYDAIIAQSPVGIQPLCGIYSRSVLHLAKTYRAQNNHRLSALLKEAKTKFIPFLNEKSFTNLNTPQEYQAMI